MEGNKSYFYFEENRRKVKWWFFFPLFILQLCYIDSQTDGGIPSYCFALMVMFFLQQRKPPLLPCLLGSWVSMSL